MAADFSYDPVTAVDEATATGETARIFADIRATMGIPLVTSIWRGLAGMDDSLPRVWERMKPLYESGFPERALDRSIDRAALPAPVALASPQLACIGIGRADLEEIRTILSAYNRSNGLNLVALAGLITPSSAARPDVPERRSLPAWPRLRRLPSRAEIGAETWEMIRYVNSLGATGLDAAVATLWRHLAHWPAFLALVYGALAPLHADGRLIQASERLVASTLDEARTYAHLCPGDGSIPPQALETIDGYVRSPVQVARMVTIGITLTRWLG
ncbi:MAG: hypothetical protein GC151_12990 [Betaproteobacteria bacterium]|nr:hypothetical protein [Betaproteobacteria bacterium]